MSWDIQKRILLVVAVLLLLLLSFAVGISFGAAFGKNYFLSTLYPALSVLGNWVAGIGALAAVFTSLWLAESQKRLNAENLDVKFSLVVLPPDMTNRLMVYVVSNGNKPSNIMSLSIISTDSKIALCVKDIDNASSQFPQYLSYGQTANFLLVKESESYINNYVSEHCNGKYSGLKAVINTAIGTFKVPFNNEIITHLKESAKSGKG